MSSEHNDSIEVENSCLSTVADSSSPPRSTEVKFPKCTSEWDCRFVDKLGVRQKEEDLFRIILSEWRLVFLSEKEQLEVEKCLDVCDLQFDYESLENVPLQRLYESGWVPSSEQVEQIRNIPLLKKFVMKLDEYNFYLAQIIRGSKSKTAISEGKYETLFEKFLQIFGICTLSQSFISTEKALIRGRSISSRADIICSLERPASERAVICVCEVKKLLQQDDTESSPPKKKTRSSCTQEAQCSFTGDQVSRMQHIGNLFVYLDKSVRPDGMLGFTIDKTWVRVTYLAVKESSWRRIQNIPANGAGSVEYEEGEHPRFFYSKRYNFLNRDDRRDLFKALLLVKKMHEIHER